MPRRVRFFCQILTAGNDKGYLHLAVGRSTRAAVPVQLTDAPADEQRAAVVPVVSPDRQEGPLRRRLAREIAGILDAEKLQLFQTNGELPAIVHLPLIAELCSAATEQRVASREVDHVRHGLEEGQGGPGLPGNEVAGGDVGMAQPEGAS
jgi:hypothetical protein